MLLNIIQQLKNINSFFFNYAMQKEQLDDMYASIQLGSLLKDLKYIPFNQMSIRPFSLMFLLNEIMVNNRRVIIEFGSGVSTLVVAKLLQSKGIKANFFSVDHDRKWLDIIAQNLNDEGLTENVQLIHAPLNDWNPKLPPWYDINSLSEKITKDIFFDLVFVDGPPAFTGEISLSRQQAVDYVQDKLQADYRIFLDDANRIGEKKVLHAWSNQLKIQFKIYSNSLAVSENNKAYNSCPSRYIFEGDNKMK